MPTPEPKPEPTPELTSNIKKISVKGDTDVFGGVRQPKRARSRKTHVTEESSPQTQPQTQTEIQPQTPPKITKVVPVAPNITHQPTAFLTADSKRPIKVVLNKAKVSHKAVKLNPKKPQNLNQHHYQHSQNKTKKSRKIILGIPGLKRRITIAQKIRYKTEHTPIEQLRAELVSKGLLKAGSKTPDEIVRQIAADAQILSKKGL